MTLLLNCQDISKSIGPRKLFESVSFAVNRGDRLGIIGANGSGKTTLARILCNLESPDSGRITVGANLLVGLLAQEESLDGELSPVQVLLGDLDGQGLDETERYGRVRAMLSRAEFDRYDDPVRALSGGWRKRLAICRALIREPDLLVMDEPTNHLDLAGILWLEKLLTTGFPGCPAAFVMISHDRFFLDAAATRIIELSSLYPAGFLETGGGYSQALRAREQFAAQQLDLQSRLDNKLRRETEWLRRGPKARSTKARYRIEEAGRLQNEFATVRSRNSARRDMDIEFEATGRRTRKLLEARGIAKAYGGRVLFEDLDLVLSPGTRLGLLGPNGCGKSTLMQVLAAAGPGDGPLPDSGGIRTAVGVNIAYFAQDRAALNLQDTLRQALAPEGETVVYRDQPLHVVTWARKFLFRPDQLDTPVGSLSGGEQARILIAGLMRLPADILLLDEPTNDLDIPALQVLEEGLLDFPGAIVLVSHDRYLLNRVCTRFLGFTGNGGVGFFASFEQWLDALRERSKPEKQNPGPPKKTRKTAGRLSYLDQREYDAMEDVISQAEAEEQSIRQVMEQPEVLSDAVQLEECWRRLETVRAEIDRLYRRWDELETIRSGPAR
ncbi:MAG: ABC-F family ATP-binding cassette domain-containing protein [Desulfobulbaceae bacterium]